MSDAMKAKEYFLEMVSASIQGLPIPACPQDIDSKKLYNLAVRNAVTNILYLAVQDEKVSLDDDIKAKLHKSYMATLAREASQQTEIEYIRNEFHKENIRFMFLKGTHLKALYPLPEMRFMVDMDVLVCEADMKKGGEIILKHGFTQEMNNGKDIVLVKKPFLTIELHKMLFVEEYFMHKYFCGVWDRAERVNENEYKMSNNDLYVYTLAHLCEHYLEAGSCFRPLMDLFLMEKSFTDLDFDYINAQFKELGIFDFAANIRQLYSCAFGNGEYNENLTIMENYIVFGAPVKNAEEASKAARNHKSKAHRIFEVVFPNLKHMRLKYPILDKFPILLPMYYIVRAFELVFSKKKNVSNKGKQITLVDKKSTEIMSEIFKKSGL